MASENTPERDRRYIEFADTLPVYFAYSETTHEVKIGFSSNVRSRIATLNSEGQWDGRRKVVLVGWLLGGPRVEAELHEMFADTRNQGEWFTPTPAMADVIAEFGGKGEPPIMKHPEFRVLTIGYWAARKRLDRVIREERVVHDFGDGVAFVTVEEKREEETLASALRPVADFAQPFAMRAGVA